MPAKDKKNKAQPAGMYGQPIQLDNLSSAEDYKGADTPKWEHVATEGEYLGYNGGHDPFTFTREIFEQMVRNLRAHPSFKAGANGFGSVGIVPWDFSHASEYHPTGGNLPVIGAPAQGWTYDLAIKTTAEGTSQLWALTLFDDLARDYVRAGKYKWASVCVVLEDVDPKTGESVGARLTSIALTNQPFIEGMEALVAERKGKDKKAAGYYYGEPAKTAEEALQMMRDVFSLAETAGASEIMAEVNKLSGWLQSGAAPLGVNIVELIGKIRCILNLRTLAPENEVLTEASNLIGRLIEESAVGSGEPGLADSLSEFPAAPTTEGEIDMSILNQLAKILDCRESEAEVAAAVEDLVELRANTKAALDADKDTSKALLEAIGAAQNDKAGLANLLEALGCNAIDEAAAKIANLSSSAAELDKIKPDFEQLKKDADKAAQEKAEAEVDAVISARNLPEDVKPALMLFRTSNPEQFKAQYPAPRADEVHLSKSITTDPKGGEVKLTDGDAQAGSKPKGDAIDLSKYPGPNKTARALNWVRANVTGADQWSHEDACEYAFRICHGGNVIDSRVS